MGKSNIKTMTYSRPEEMDYSIILNTDRDMDKLIRRIEKIIRSSMEYRDYVAYLKEYVDMSSCAFYHNVENGQGSKVRIEIHHEPLTLYDIVAIVLNKYIDECIPLNDLYIADEVLDLHYRNMVGLVPLSKTIHQIVHNSNEIIIPLSLVYGNYKEFLTEYNDYLDDRILEKIEKKVNESKHFTKEMAEKLTPSYVYLEVEGFQLPKKMEIQSKEEIA